MVAVPVCTATTPGKFHVLAPSVPKSKSWSTVHARRTTETIRVRIFARIAGAVAATIQRYKRIDDNQPASEPRWGLCRVRI